MARTTRMRATRQIITLQVLQGNRYNQSAANVWGEARMPPQPYVHACYSTTRIETTEVQLEYESDEVDECSTSGSTQPSVTSIELPDSDSRTEDCTPRLEIARISNPTPRKSKPKSENSVDGKLLTCEQLEVLKASRIFDVDGKEWYRCTVCKDRNPMVKRDFYRHLNAKSHQKPNVPCPECPDQMFTRNDSMKRHLKTHHPKQFEILYPEKKVEILNI